MARSAESGVAGIVHRASHAFARRPGASRAPPSMAVFPVSPRDGWRRHQESRLLEQLHDLLGMSHWRPHAPLGRLLHPCLQAKRRRKAAQGVEPNSMHYSAFPPLLVLMAMVTAFMGQAMPSGGAGFTAIAIIFEPVNLPVADFVYVLSLNWLRARFACFFHGTLH